MKRYEFNGRFYWFDPDKAPEGAVEVKAKKPDNKAVEAENKAPKPRKKAKK